GARRSEFPGVAVVGRRAAGPLDVGMRRARLVAAPPDDSSSPSVPERPETVWASAAAREPDVAAALEVPDRSLDPQREAGWSAAQRALWAEAQADVVAPVERSPPPQRGRAAAPRQSRAEAAARRSPAPLVWAAARARAAAQGSSRPPAQQQPAPARASRRQAAAPVAARAPLLRLRAVPAPAQQRVRRPAVSPT